MRSNRNIKVIYQELTRSKDLISPDGLSMIVSLSKFRRLEFYACVTHLDKMRRENEQQWPGNHPHQQRQMQLKLSTIMKEELHDVAQGYGFYIDKHGKYCALAAVVKYFGYDLALSQKMNKAAVSLPGALIPHHIMERIEAFPTFGNNAEYQACSCRKANYYKFTMMSLLIYLNDFHHMTFEEIGDWLET